MNKHLLLLYAFSGILAEGQDDFRTIVHDTPRGSLVIKHLTPPPRVPSGAASSQAASFPAPAVSTNGVNQHALSTPSRSLLVTASVFEGKGSLLEWRHQGMKYQAWSRVDFGPLEGHQIFPWKGVNYQVLLLVTSSSQGMMKTPHQALAGGGQSGEFFLVAGNTTDRNALVGVQALHEFYRVNQYKLTASKPASLKASASQTRQAPETIELRLWKKPSPKSSIRK